MIRQQTIPHGLLCSVSPEQLAQMHIIDDAFGDEFDWDESTSRYEGDVLASDMRGCMAELGAE